MKTRAITGAIFVAIVLASLMLGTYIFTAFVLALSLLMLNEFYQLVTKATTIRPQRIGGLVLAISVHLPLISIYLSLRQYLFRNDPVKNLFLCVPIIAIIIISELYRKQQNPFHNIAYTLFGVLFVSVPCCFFYALAFMDGVYNMHYPLAFLLLLWSNDVGAYLVGSTLGKRKLFEYHSPNKSWEGFLGGMFSSILVSLIISIYFKEFMWIHWLTIALIITIAGTFGDLIESMLKRSLSIKDSGSILPGHGGLLDRFDGLLLAAPLVLIYLQVMAALHWL